MGIQYVYNMLYYSVAMGETAGARLADFQL